MLEAKLNFELRSVLKEVRHAFPKRQFMWYYVANQDQWQLLVNDLTPIEAKVILSMVANHKILADYHTVVLVDRNNRILTGTDLIREVLAYEQYITTPEEFDPDFTLFGVPSGAGYPFSMWRDMYGLEENYLEFKDRQQGLGRTTQAIISEWNNYMRDYEDFCKEHNHLVDYDEAVPAYL